MYTGFEEGIGDMRPGGKRRMIIPPELGPPVGFLNLLCFDLSLMGYGTALSLDFFFIFSVFQSLFCLFTSVKSVEIHFS